jgi:hypothetical protein
MEIKVVVRLQVQAINKTRHDACLGTVLHQCPASDGDDDQCGSLLIPMFFPCVRCHLARRIYRSNAATARCTLRGRRFETRRRIDRSLAGPPVPPTSIAGLG